MPKRPGVNGCPVQCAGLISALWCIVFPSADGASWKALLNSYIKTCDMYFILIDKIMCICDVIF